MPSVIFADETNFGLPLEKTIISTSTAKTSSMSTATTLTEDSSSMMMMDDHNGSGMLPSLMDSSDGEGISEHSERSEGSGTSNGSGSRTSSSKHLRGNLTRVHKNRDPFSYYEKVKILGEGSMGMVAQVRKRDNRIGGSARYNLKARAKEQEKWNNCFSLPLGLGKLFEHFLHHKAKQKIEEASLHVADCDMSSSFQKDVDYSMFASESASSSALTSVSGNGGAFAPTLAMKSIHLQLIRDQVFIDELENEIAILKTLDHPHIVRVIETYYHVNEIFVVMDLCSGGDLYSRDPYTEDQAARIVHSILSAVAYMHSKGVIHRDIKFENILFEDDSPHAGVKLIDFGLSKPLLEHEVLNEGAGTIYTMAPEVLRGEYSKQADLWSIGVVAYMLLSSQLPFFGEKRNHVVKQILSGTYQFKGKRWRKASGQAKAFVEDLLVVDPKERAPSDEALSATWLNRRHTATVRNPNAGELKNVKKSIERYVRYPKLRQLALMVIAHQSTSQEIGFLRKVFKHYDADQTGYLDFQEFKAAMKDVGLTETGYREMFDAVDVDGSGRVLYTEFLAATIEATGWISEERLAEAFDRVDSDDSGYISRENLINLLGDEYPEEELNILIDQAGYEKGKGISYERFMGQWNDDKAKFEREWRQNMLDGVDHSNPPGSPHGMPSDVSELSFDGSETHDPGRPEFVEKKSTSVRKMAVIAAA